MPPITSSSDTSSISLSTDYEIIRIVMKEIAEYLQSIEPLNAITEPVLQRIATIVISHLNSALNERLLLTNFRRIDRDHLMVKLRAFAGNRMKFLRHIEHYLQVTFMDGVVDNINPEPLQGMCVERDVSVGMESPEVLQQQQQKAKKKQNNEPGHVQLSLRASVMAQQVSEEGEEEEGDGVEGAAEHSDGEEQKETEAAAGDLVQIESNDDAPLANVTQEKMEEGEAAVVVDEHEVSEITTNKLLPNSLTNFQYTLCTPKTPKLSPGRQSKH